jgi:hypothetical protein
MLYTPIHTKEPYNHNRREVLWWLIGADQHVGELSNLGLGPASPNFSREAIREASSQHVPPAATGVRGLQGLSHVNHRHEVPVLIFVLFSYEYSYCDWIG